MFTGLRLFRVALLGEVLRVRPMTLTIAGVAAAQLAAGHFRVGIPCVFHEATGLPCPGCGLTRSCLALFEGRLTDAVYLHPFGPVLLGALVFCLVGGLLPEPRRKRLADVVEDLEIRTGLVPLLFAAFLLVWVLRVTHAIALASV
jgi:hypothetical protein